MKRCNVRGIGFVFWIWSIKFFSPFLFSTVCLHFLQVMVAGVITAIGRCVWIWPNSKIQLLQWCNSNLLVISKTFYPKPNQLSTFEKEEEKIFWKFFGKNKTKLDVWLDDKQEILELILLNMKYSQITNHNY